MELRLSSTDPSITEEEHDRVVVMYWQKYNATPPINIVVASEYQTPMKHTDSP